MKRGRILLSAVLLPALLTVPARAAAPQGRAEKERPARTVTLSEESVAKSGIVAVPVARAAESPRVRAFASVVDARGMIDLHNGYRNAVAALKKARAADAASKSEYERLKKLNASGKNVSDRALQAAESAWLADRAELGALIGAPAAARDSMIQAWGRVMARWIIKGSAPYRRIASLEDVVVQMTFPAEAAVREPPREVAVEPYPGTRSTARFVSAAPKADPRIQGMSFFYVAPFSRGLAPGTNLSVYLPAGKRVAGAVIPASAIVWTEGRAWAYTEAAKGRFERTEVDTGRPVEGGFLTGGFPAGTRVVVRGAEILLSEEFRSRVREGD